MPGSYFRSVLLSGLIAICGGCPVWSKPVSPSNISGFQAGSIVIKTGERRLHLVVPGGKVLSYPLGVGRQGRKWQGMSEVSRKVLKPTWAPPPDILRDNPKLPRVVRPGPSNPLGAAVLVLGDGTYGIHGTNNDSSIGKDISYGCFRMYNKDVLDLYARVDIGAPVYVLH